LGKDLFGQNTIFLSADVIPPIEGDISVKLVGPESLDYSVSSRYPPGVPLVNRSHPWYRFEDGTFKGVHPGDDLGVIVTVDPPAAPGEYELILANARTGQPYITVPVLFERPGEGEHAAAPPAGAGVGAPVGGQGAVPAGGEEAAPENAEEPCH
jgi:hypothetical protein